MGSRWIVRRGSVVAALLLMSAIMALRFAVSDPSEPVTFLMVVPIGLLAAEFGFRGGVVGAALASAMVIFWDALVDPNLTGLGYSLRFVVFLATGTSFGLVTQSRREIEGESQRWFDTSLDLNCVVDLDGNFLRVNAAFGLLLGYKPPDLLGTPYISYVHPDDVEKTVALAAQLADGQANVGGFENRYRAADGSYRWLRWTSTTDHARGRIYATARDETETKQLEVELLGLAQTDPLTGLLNRRAFQSQAQRQVDFLRRYGPGGALFLFDIDRFKHINDSFGHNAGDEALKKAAEVIRERTRATDICARIGGDEFVILFPGVGQMETELLANGLLGSIVDQSIAPDGQRVPMSTSIGIALFSQSDAESVEVLITKADTAMYEAKRAGGNRFSFATSEVVKKK